MKRRQLIKSLLAIPFINTANLHAKEDSILSQLNIPSHWTIKRIKSKKLCDKYHEYIDPKTKDNIILQKYTKSNLHILQDWINWFDIFDKTTSESIVYIDQYDYIQVITKTKVQKII